MENEIQKQTSSDQKYLDRLSFNPELRKTWLNFFVTNFRVVILLIILLTAWGLYSFFILPRESSPEVKIPMAVVTTVYPGASPSDVEEFVTKKLETGISGIKGIDTISSGSYNSMSSITVEFDAKEDIDDAIRRLRDKVSSIKSQISDDANEPTVTEISLDDQPIWSISITGPYDGFTLRKYAEEIKDELERIQGVREISISGGDEREIRVEYMPERLLFYGVQASTVNQVIAATNIAIPSGNFESGNFIIPVRTDARVYDVESIKNIPIVTSANGSTVFVRDLANVSEQAIKKEKTSRLSISGSEPQNSVSLSIIKRVGSSIVDTVKEAKNATDAKIKSFPPGITYSVTTDYADLIDEQFNQLTHDFILTLVLVFVILLIIVGLKEAFVAGLAIPLVFFASFGMLSALGMTLNFLSLFSLILALGLLVDDAIVVVSATKQYLKTGKFTPEEAVLLVLNDFKVVLTTTTLTTVWAFLPLLLATGIMGEYMKSIPVTVSITLISSLLIALMINHPLAAVLERIRLTRKTFFIWEAILIALTGVSLASKNIWGICIGVLLILIELYLLYWYEKKGKEITRANEELVKQEWKDENLIKQKLREQGSHENDNIKNRLMHGILHFDAIIPWYERMLRKVTGTKKARWVTIGAVSVLFMFAMALLITGAVEREFFPVTDMDYVYIDIQLPTGTKLSETDAVTKKVEERLLKISDVKNFSTIVGGVSPLSYGGRASQNGAAITLNLKKKELREQKSYELADQIRNDLRDIKDAKITVSVPRNGPPSGSAFEAQIAGDNLETLSKIAHDLRPQLESIPGAINTSISLKDSAPEFTFKLDSEKMSRNSLNAAYVGSVLRMAVSGVEVTNIIRDEKEIKIVASFGESDIPDLSALQNLQIVNTKGQSVFLKDVAKIELVPSVESIKRVDQKRVVTLSADVAGTTNATAVLSAFQKNIKEYALPDGYAITYGGENEQNQESVMSIVEAMLVAMILIVATLIIQFNSFKKAFIVLATIPLALIGVFFGMAISGISLSFPGLIGILALFGIVVKNAIILMDKINLNIKTGIPFYDSVIDAGKSRIEAIFITSFCTIFGILPITLSNEMWRSLGSAVIFGLLLSSFLTLFIVPTLFLTFVREDERM